MSDRKRKRSWRDVDRKKDKSTQVRRMEAPGTDPYSHRTNKSYKAELDRFFEKGVASSRIKDLMASTEKPDAVESETPARVKLIRKVRTAETFDGFVQAVNALRQDGGLPNDADVLTRTLEHPDDEAVHEALERLLDMSKRLDMATMKSIAARLDTLENVTDNPDTLKLIEALRAKI